MDPQIRMLLESVYESTEDGQSTISIPLTPTKHHLEVQDNPNYCDESREPTGFLMLRLTRQLT